VKGRAGFTLTAAELLDPADRLSIAINFGRSLEYRRCVVQVAAMKPKSTGSGPPAEEGKRSEDAPENRTETSQKHLGLSPDSTCVVESLLKACVSTQEKTSDCNRNGAPTSAHFAYASVNPAARRNAGLLTGSSAGLPTRTGSQFRRWSRAGSSGQQRVGSKQPAGMWYTAKSFHSLAVSTPHAARRVPWQFVFPWQDLWLRSRGSPGGENCPQRTAC
jgi:hypothetical protein